MSLDLVCFTPHVPYPGIDHAGGGALQSYLDMTTHLGRRTMVAPGFARNLGREPRNLDELHLVRPVRTISGGIRNRIARYSPGHRLYPGMRDLILSDEATVAALRRADVVEYHWQEIAAALLPRARTLAPQARQVVFLYDVASQALTRAAASQTGLSAARKRADARAAAADEELIASLADAVIVLSEKDRNLLPDEATVIVQRPVVRVKPQLEPRRTGTPPVFLFVGAFDRAENVEAATWLRAEVWPRIRDTIDDAQLRFAGVESDRRLTGLLDPSFGVTATGYVADLDAEYRGADVALVPLLRGAGVKFKTLEAMITALPTVSTTIGAEGIDRAADFIEIADSPETFAEAALRLASDTSGTFALRALEGARWTMNAHGEAPSRAALTYAITGVPAADGQK